MKIQDALSFFNIISDDVRRAKGVTCNSKEVKKDYIFIALEKGNQYIDEAINNGAILILSDEKNNKIYISNLKYRLLEFFLFFYAHLEKHIRFIGVTGTNGKSTTAYLLHSLLKKSLLITTSKGIKNSYVSKNTTPYPFEMIEAIKLAKKRKLKYIVMELSSIGIREGRLNGLSFDKIILTNITSDHLDYHRSLKEYQNSKIEFLFSSDAFIYLSTKEYVKFRALRKLKHFELYSSEEAKVIECKNNRTRFIYKNNQFVTKLIGEMNVINIVSVLTMLSSFMNLKTLKKRLKKVEPLKGRMNIISFNPLVIIDYAHTSSAFKEALECIRKFKKNKLIVVFGAGGNRDRSKRREYGKLVEEYGDIGIVTSDNPRDEDEEKIIDEIILDSDFYFIRSPSRSRAIALAFSYASKDDVIAIIGKGEEQYQIIKGVKYRFSDEEEVRKCLKNI